MEPPQFQRDTQLEEFIKSEIHCRNFINQDLSFLHPSTVFSNEDLGNQAASEQIVNELPLPSPNQENTKPPTLPEVAIHNRSRSVGQPTPIQPVEPILRLTQEEQEIQEEAPDLSLEQLLGLSYCQDQINTPLQTLDGIYVRQPSRFLLLAQEAQKIAKKIKEEEQAS